MHQSLEQYAQSKVGQFLTADSGPPPSSADGDLTGQCVSQVKWVMQDFTDIPNPFAARGHARYLGINLVAQGHAVEVSKANAKPGDVVCYEYGTYGHTGTLLSGNRFFQQNANVAGAKRRVLSDGTVVYSVTIVPLYASLGGVAPKFYRLKTFKEGNGMTEELARQISKWGRLLGFNSEEKMYAAAEDDINHIMADPMYAAALLEQLYKGEWQEPAWKANNYDANGKAKYQEGFTAGEAAAGDGAEYTPVAEVNGQPTLYTKKVKE